MRHNIVTVPLCRHHLPPFRTHLCRQACGAGDGSCRWRRRSRSQSQRRCLTSRRAAPLTRRSARLATRARPQAIVDRHRTHAARWPESTQDHAPTCTAQWTTPSGCRKPWSRSPWPCCPCPRSPCPRTPCPRSPCPRSPCPRSPWSRTPWRLWSTTRVVHSHCQRPPAWPVTVRAAPRRAGAVCGRHV